VAIRLEEFISESSNAVSETALLDLYLKTVEGEGYQNAVFAKTRGKRLAGIPWNHFPDGYRKSYLENEWDKIDPVVQQINQTTRPFLWSDVFESPRLNERQRRFIEDCRDLGVHSGLTIPMHGPGSEVDLISLSLREHKATDATRIPLVHAITVQYRTRLYELQGETISSCKALTQKETECLNWCKEGKTNWEIGEILSISEKTVEFHLSNTTRKLGVSTRITAVVKGLQLGLIKL
jgi:DNA-binding CsgD family transcriptional regulator